MTQDIGEIYKKIGNEIFAQSIFLSDILQVISCIFEKIAYNSSKREKRDADGEEIASLEQVDRLERLFRGHSELNTIGSLSLFSGS